MMADCDPSMSADVCLEFEKFQQVMLEAVSHAGCKYLKYVLS